MSKRREMRSFAPFPAEDEDVESSIVDFRNASLYLPGLQILVAVLACSLTSVLACWLLPAHAVSAVRTLTLAVIVGAMCVRKPLRLGRVHGLQLVFAALRPAVAVYLSCLVVEQLCHGCAVSPEVTPSWRRVVFQACVLAMIASGFLRARQPLAKTDVPFLITLFALLLVAALPPPAVALSGPLCEPVTLFAAAERLVRALCFGSCYTVFVYVSAPPTGTTADILVCLTRASAASVWVLGATLPLLVLSLPQCALAIFSRIQIESSELLPSGSRYSVAHNGDYGALPTQSPGDRSLSPIPLPPDSPRQKNQMHAHSGGANGGADTATLSGKNTLSQLSSVVKFGPLSFKEVKSHPTAACCGPVGSSAHLAAVAASLEAEEDPETKLCFLQKLPPCP